MNITLSDFFKTDMNDVVLKNKVVCFKSKEYTPVFFATLFKVLRPNSLNINFINISDLDILNLKLQLEQSFLGNNNFYWLGNITNYKYKKELILYLNSYQGPHYVTFFINDEEIISFNKLTITYDGFITLDEYNSLLVLWPNVKQDLIRIFIKKIFELSSKLSLDQFCIFVNYSLLLGARHSSFMSDWLEKILISNQSFFTLSKHFFAFEPKSFYKYWNIISNNYSSVFWTTYWSEQLYRAFNFILLRKQGKNLQAKQVAYKLPFSFIQNDWKKASLSELREAHQFIYDLDCSIKNGASDFSVELFYVKFFERRFEN